MSSLAAAMDPAGYVQDEIISDMEYIEKIAVHEKTFEAMEKYFHDVDENLFCCKCRTAWPEEQFCKGWK